MAKNKRTNLPDANQSKETIINFSYGNVSCENKKPIWTFRMIDQCDEFSFNVNKIKSDGNFDLVFIAWDPDYTKVTEQEQIRMEQAEESGFVDEDDVDWDNLDKYLLD